MSAGEDAGMEETSEVTANEHTNETIASHAEGRLINSAQVDVNQNESGPISGLGFIAINQTWTYRSVAIFAANGVETDHDARESREH